jgi:hypothetical protein
MVLCAAATDWNTSRKSGLTLGGLGSRAVENSEWFKTTYTCNHYPQANLSHSRNAHQQGARTTPTEASQAGDHSTLICPECTSLIGMGPQQLLDNSSQSPAAGNSQEGTFAARTSQIGPFRQGTLQQGPLQWGHQRGLSSPLQQGPL